MILPRITTPAFLLLLLMVSFCSLCFGNNIDRKFDKNVDINLDELKGVLLYSNPLSRKSDVANWHMEGPGEVVFNEGWMTVYSPGEAMHHVFWCPEDFPGSFVAEWEAQNLNTDAGLVIVFFAALGLDGKDIFDFTLPTRDGTFEQYTLGKIRSYHISYYANAAHNKNRGHANLRKNNTFQLVQEGEEGIPTQSTTVHKVRLLKADAHIVMYIDERKIIDWIDDGSTWGPVWDSGKIGFRQMQWTKFRYRNFKLWSLKPKKVLIKSGFKDFRPAIHGLKALEIFKSGLNQSFPNN